MLWSNFALVKTKHDFCMVFIIYFNTYVALPNTDHQGWFLRPAGPTRSEMICSPCRANLRFFFGWGVATRKKFTGKGLFFLGLGDFFCLWMCHRTHVKYHGIKGKFQKKTIVRPPKYVNDMGPAYGKKGLPLSLEKFLIGMMMILHFPPNDVIPPVCHSPQEIWPY